MPDYGRGKRPITEPRRREAQMRADRDAILAALSGNAEREGFSDRAIRQLVDKGERSARGSKAGDDGTGRRSKGDHTDPTEAEASAREPADKVGRWIRECASLLDHAAQTMAEAHGRLQLALNAPETEWEAQVKGEDCRACLRNVSRQDNDRLRSGYCPACHQAWMRVKADWTEQGLPDAPDRPAFERERRQRAASLAEEAAS